MPNLFRSISLLAILFLAAIPSNGSEIKNDMQPDPDISVDNLIQTVHFLSTIHPPRNYKNLESLRISADYIFQKLTQYGLSPTRQQFIVSGRIYENIIASTGPAAVGRNTSNRQKYPFRH